MSRHLGPVALDLEGLRYHGCSSGTATPPMVRDQIVAACAEIDKLRGEVANLRGEIRDREAAWDKEAERHERDHRAAAGMIEDLRAELRAIADPMKLRCADALADEVAVLVRRKVIDPRSPAGDALLDYRDPPSSPRADRLAELERDRDAWKQRAAELAEMYRAALAKDPP